MFSNLLGNAIQYGFRGTPIRVDVAGSVDAVTITVSNDGVPIPPQKIAMIFDPLIRGSSDAMVPSSNGNLGLGLYITKEVVVAHGGTIEVTSTETEGTSFKAWFPVWKPSPTAQVDR